MCSPYRRLLGTCAAHAGWFGIFCETIWQPYLTLSNTVVPNWWSVDPWWSMTVLQGVHGKIKNYFSFLPHGGSGP